MLGGPAPLRLGPVVVGPDDLVEEAVAPEELVEQQLDVVGLAVVEVDVEGSVSGEQPPRLAQARLEEAEVVVEGVVVGERAEQACGVAVPAEAGSVALAFVRAGDGQSPPLLRAPCVEGRVDVDEVERLVR